MLGNSDPAETFISHILKFLLHFKDFLSESVIRLTHKDLLSPVGLERFQIGDLNILVAIHLKFLRFSFLVTDGCY